MKKILNEWRTFMVGLKPITEAPEDEERMRKLASDFGDEDAMASMKRDDLRRNQQAERKVLNQIKHEFYTGIKQYVKSLGLKHDSSVEKIDYTPRPGKNVLGFKVKILLQNTISPPEYFSAEEQLIGAIHGLVGFSSILLQFNVERIPDVMKDQPKIQLDIAREDVAQRSMDSLRRRRGFGESENFQEDFQTYEQLRSYLLDFQSLFQMIFREDFLRARKTGKYSDQDWDDDGYGGYTGPSEKEKMWSDIENQAAARGTLEEEKKMDWNQMMEDWKKGQDLTDYGWEKYVDETIELQILDEVVEQQPETLLAESNEKHRIEQGLPQELQEQILQLVESYMRGEG